MKVFPSLRRGSVVIAAGFLGACGAPIEPVGELSEPLTVYEVGPGKAYATLQAVASSLQPGDVVNVYGGTTYGGGVRLTRPGTPTNKIRIVGVKVGGKRPVLSGGTNTIEFAANHYEFEGFDVTGGSSRCVFHHAHDITIRDTVIHDCPAHGLLGADSDSGSLTLEHSEVYRCGSGDRLHQIYMTTDQYAYPGAVFRMQHCYVHDANGGNNVKTRAERNEIYYNWIEGAYYHELELIGPDGGTESLKREDSDVVGNVLFQGYPTRSHYAVRVGGDGTGQTFGRFRFLNNTIVLGSASTAAVFRVFDGIESLEVHNNVIYRDGGGAVTVLRDADANWRNGRVVAGTNNWVTTGSSAVPSEWRGTVQGSSPGFSNLGARDVRPLSSSGLRDAGIANPSSPSGYSFPSPLAAATEEPPLHALGAAVRRTAVGTIDIGAFEYGNGGGTVTPPPDPTTPPPDPTTPPPMPPSTGALVLHPIEDTYIRAGQYASTNFGTSSSLHVKSDSTLDFIRHAYLRFDLGTLPSVRNAKFRVYAALTGPASVTPNLYRMITSWAETGVTWNSRPGYVSFPALGSFTVTSTTPQWFEIDVTSYVASERTAGRRLVSFALQCPAPSVERVDIASREATANRPELVVTP